MRLWVRAAASPTIGLGHLLRQVALVERAAEHGLGATFVVDAPDLARQALGRFGELRAPIVDAAATWMAEVSPDDIVLFDGYQFGPVDHAEARSAGCLVAAVDDRGTGRFDVDLLCDHNPIPVAYDLPGDATLLHGLDYALVRREFLGGRRPTPDDREHLLVAFGGTDAAGLLPLALDLLAERTSFPVVTVLVGPATAERGGALPSGVRMTTAPADVAAVHAAADAALITVGTTLWELLVRATPTAAIALDPLHRRIVDAVVARGAAVDGGDLDDWGARLPTTLDVLAEPSRRAGLAEGATALVDGQGPRRVLDELLARRVR
jgi:spore coat polysaccharide biosynthesis predicted glycosyltransferase SpsG